MVLDNNLSSCNTQWTYQYSWGTPYPDCDELYKIILDCQSTAYKKEEEENTMYVFEVFLINTDNDEVVRHTHLVARDENTVVARLGLSESELKKLDKGKMVVHTNVITSYIKPKKDE